jgi:hypothetical protein
MDAAVTDLERSLELLPTAPAHFALGDIAKVRGDRDEAIEHYKVVASAGGEYGEAATAELVKLDLSANPGTYVNHGCSADGNGNLVVSVRNETLPTQMRMAGNSNSASASADKFHPDRLPA